jgi:aspartate racemase
MQEARKPANAPVLGILGGMGPAATADFLAKFVRATPVARDQDHISTITCSFPQIPDRSEAILGNGASPLPAMQQVLARLEACGATYIAIPCNTAHYWFETLQSETGLPIVHIVDATARWLLASGLNSGAVGLLATSATVHTKVYADRLDKFGIGCLVPDEADQALVMNVIRAVKLGEAFAWGTKTIGEVAVRLMDRGAVAVILGNSELPVAVQTGMPAWVDSTDALAHECVRQARLISR